LYTRQLFLLFTAAVCAGGAQPQVSVAASANLSGVLAKVGEVFERQTGIHPVFSFGSTAQLALQIEHGAPFDVFAAADTAHIDQLAAKGVTLSSAVYATGVLALWFPQGAAKRPEDLATPAVRVIAIAKPELAPYGEAAIQSLDSLGLRSKVNSRIVYASNIAMATQYGTSGNADAVFTAYSLVMHEKGTVIKIDPKLYAPIRQSAAVVASSSNRSAARAFLDFLMRGNGRGILLASGYEAPR
jgi:molybdate transport system substrate-binding protein